jgi:hypothetical protein
MKEVILRLFHYEGKTCDSIESCDRSTPSRFFLKFHSKSQTITYQNRTEQNRTKMNRPAKGSPHVIDLVDSDSDDDRKMPAQSRKTSEVYYDGHDEEQNGNESSDGTEVGELALKHCRKFHRE